MNRHGNSGIIHHRITSCRVRPNRPHLPDVEASNCRTTTLSEQIDPETVRTCRIDALRQTCTSIRKDLDHRSIQKDMQCEAFTFGELEPPALHVARDPCA